MPRLPGVPSWTRCDQRCLPVTASRATMALAGPSRNMTPSTTIGLKPKLPFLSGTGKNHACSSRLTLPLLICVSAEYCMEFDVPPYSLHVVYDGVAGAVWPRSAIARNGRMDQTLHRRGRGRQEDKACGFEPPR